VLLLVPYGSRNRQRPRPKRGVGGLLGGSLVVALLGAGALGLGVAAITPQPGTGCPPRSSRAIAVGPHTLHVRVEEPRAGTTLVHLCTGPSTGAVSGWSATVAERVIPVLSVAAREGLAAVTSPISELDFSVTIRTASGELTRFSF
jgi:hypothetical protein